MEYRFRANIFTPLLLAACLAVALPVSAEDFWVLGSFENQEVAREEGSRISNETGVEVLLYESLVDNRTWYRLLTGLLSDEGDREGLRRQLQKVGISDPWTLQLGDEMPYMETVFADISVMGDLDEAELAEIDAMLSEFDDEMLDDTMTDSDWAFADTSNGTVNYVSAGSFAESGQAETFAASLTGLLHEVKIQPGAVSGTFVHRVLVGPVLASEEQAVLESLRSQGIEGAWVLRGIPAPVVPESADVSDPSLDISRPVQGKRIPGLPRDRSPQGRSLQKRTVPEQPGSESDFNLARLRK